MAIICVVRDNEINKMWAKRMKVRHIGLAALAAALFATPAIAGDHDWSGFYAGGTIGYEVGNEDWTLLDNPGDGESGSIGKIVTTQDVDGFLGGVVVGRNWQRGDLVWGVEAEFAFTNAQGSSARVSTGAKPGPREWSTNSNWVATFGPRVGQTRGKTLYYIEGGLALENADHYHLGAKGGPPPGTGSERAYYGTDTRYGVFVGAGVEHAYNNAWSSRFEYNFVAVDNGSAKLWGSPSQPAVFGIGQGVHAVKFGLIYHFK